GSTGQPKGVMVNHHNWLSYHQAITQLYGLSSDERILQLSSISFDIFIEELTVSLFSGGTLVIPTAEKVLSCGQFWDSLDKYQISVASLPTALWHQLCVDPQLSAVGKPHSLRLIITGGEAMSASHLTMWQQRAPKNIQLLNTYGPTEATVIASCFDVSDYDPGLNSVPIGMSTKNSSLIVLDQHQKMVPKGVVGELYIGGEGVATGYLNQTQMTQDSFVTNPYNIDASPRLYKTGDLVRVLADDNFEFIGRTDDQVKIRGFRIVMGEIEHQISQCHEVKSNLVCAIEDEDKQKRLVAYIQLVAQADLDPLASIRQHLQQVLPEYMIPSALVVIEDWPLTANGKIDQQQLPLPDIDLLQNKYSAAQTKTENTLVQIWADLLKQAPEKVSVQANFFDLGGHSLLLIRLNAQMEFDYSIKFPVHELYNHSTIEQQAKLVDRLLNSTADDLTITEVIEADNHSSEANVVLLKQGDSQLPPLYFIHPVGGQVACYITLVNQLNYSGSIYGIHRTNASELSIEAVAGQYNELIFNHNEQQVPCRLVGWSMGGVVAYEMAQQLNQAANIDLIMIDSYNPAANAADTSLSAEDLNLQILNIMLNELGISYGHVPEDTFNQPLTELLTLALQLGKEQQVFPSTFSFESLTKRFEVLRENSRALTGYKPAKYGGKVSLLKAKDSQGYQPHGWDKLVTNLSVSVVEGEHFSLMLKPDVLGVADKLNGIDWTSDRVTLNR
ncbi:MAG: AMP-binding protein, partial [Algicola sp.]|nr:AMP-binding protein [Algicola sp.]